MASHIPGSRVVCGVGLPAAHRGCQGQVEAHEVRLFLPGGFLWEPVFVPACHSPYKHWVLLTEMLANKVSQKKPVSAHLPLKSVSHWMSHTGGEQYKLRVLCPRKCCRVQHLYGMEFAVFLWIKIWIWQTMRPTNKMTEPSSASPRAGSYPKDYWGSPPFNRLEDKDGRK